HVLARHGLEARDSRVDQARVVELDRERAELRRAGRCAANALQVAEARRVLGLLQLPLRNRLLLQFLDLGVDGRLYVFGLLARTHRGADVQTARADALVDEAADADHQL